MANGAWGRQMTDSGLTQREAQERLARFGANALPETAVDSLLAIFLRQFLSPLIYILVAAALVSLVVSDIKDALFIGAVLVVNGIVGAAQEYSAGRAAAALRRMEQSSATVIRDGQRREIDARDLVPGDTVLLEAGGRVPADIRLLEAGDLRCDESMLTGESEPSHKRAADPSCDEAGRAHLAFSGTLITRGRGRGEVVATGLSTELGGIADVLGEASRAKPPLLLRLERLSRMIALAVLFATVLLVGIGLLRGMPLTELFMVAVGLAVSAIPEGLPVAITVALAIAMRRMAKSHVIMRNLPAIESLGSCTMIATDKTGTLTMNELTVTDIALPDGSLISLDTHAPHDGEPNGPSQGALPAESQQQVGPLLHAAVLPNEAQLTRDGDTWLGTGDTVDIALLSAAYRGGVVHADAQARHPLIARIPYEPDLKYAASFHRGEKHVRIFVKGAPDTLIAMAASMRQASETVPVDREKLLKQTSRMAARGLRVLAFAEGRIEGPGEGAYDHSHLEGLTFLGLAGMKDPLRPEVPDAIRACHAAGIAVAMVTGDDPITACAIARDAGLSFEDEDVVTGAEVRDAVAKGLHALDGLTRDARIYARVEPLQKLAIVESMARNGHVVAVTGDGVNDAPALKHAHVGVAMGRKGTDIARESADIILTDDNFASLIRGIREGRVAYANIRKVVFMLMGTGAAEVILFLLAITAGLPMPLLAVQLLWLNLVTNGIQDVALAAEKAEGDELSQPPRRSDETLFDRLMVRRIVITAFFIGIGGFALFQWRVTAGDPVDMIRNELLLLFVLFENAMTLSARSERNLLLGRSRWSNPLLLAGVAVTQLLHIAAMYVPFMADTLGLAPVSLSHWALLLIPAAALFGILEFDKWLRRR